MSRKPGLEIANVLKVVPSEVSMDVVKSHNEGLVKFTISQNAEGVLFSVAISLVTNLPSFMETPIWRSVYIYNMRCVRERLKHVQCSLEERTIAPFCSKPV